ncbi:DUF4085 family protein [Sporosarcina sp. UB5]|uniref:DUF4085 family protein n=1 Tax=Sporosarcina sp. UB5 TaxID=3047463 RepID=UPI003D7A9506
MKYYTKERYEEMQVRGFLVFPPSKEEWVEIVKSYYDMGIDYIENIKSELEYRKKDLLKYLPESVHSSIHEKTLMTEYPSDEILNILNRCCEDYDTKSQRILNESRKSYESIKNKLPKSIIHLFENSLHDARVISFEYESEKQECILALKHHQDGKYVKVGLIFTGVKDLKLEGNIKEESLWLYEEIYLGDSEHFELHVLLDYPLTELCIKAQDLKFTVLT